MSNLIDFPVGMDYSQNRKNEYILQKNETKELHPGFKNNMGFV